MKPSQLLQETPGRYRVSDRRRPMPIIMATLGNLVVAASMTTVALVAVHHSLHASIPSPAVVIRADPSSPPPPGATGNPDQQPRHVCTHWDPENNTTQDEPCDSPS